MKEIARENCVEIDPPQTADIMSELQQNQVEDLYSAICDLDWDLKVSNTDVKSPLIGLQDLNNVEMEENTKPDVLSIDWRKLVSATEVEKQRELDTVYEPEIVQDKISSPRNSGICSTNKVSTSSPQQKMETITEATTSVCSFQISERNIIYVDDVEEFQSSIQEDSNWKDQRLFLFKSTYTPREKEFGDPEKKIGDNNRASVSDLCHGFYDDDQKELCVSSDERTSLRNAAKRRKSSSKRSKRRYLYLENQRSESLTLISSSIKDVECALYYNDSWHRRRKNQKNMSVGEIRSFSYSTHERKLSSSRQWCKQQRSIIDEHCCVGMGESFFSHKSKYQRRVKSSCGFNCDNNAECSLDHPCYFVTSDDKENLESPTPMQMNGNTELLEYHPNWKPPKKGSVKTSEMGSVSHFKKPRLRRDYNNSTQVMHEVIDSQNHKQNEEIKEEQVPDCHESYASSSGSCTRETSPWVKKYVPPPYLRTMTMPPPEKPKETPKDQVYRSA